MIIISTKLDKFVVEPWMELEPFDPKLIKELSLNHPYKILLFFPNTSPAIAIVKKWMPIQIVKIM